MSRAGVALGQRRLAVIELSERGTPPMYLADGRFVLVFNGEIYHHHSLRRELGAARAVNWRGTSDTETLVECFALWGIATTLRKTVGMFAFALWDCADRTLTLAAIVSEKSRSIMASSDRARRPFIFPAPSYGDEILGGSNRYAIGPQLWRRINTSPRAVRGVIHEAAAQLPEWACSALASMPGLGKSLAPLKDKAYKLAHSVG